MCCVEEMSRAIARHVKEKHIFTVRHTQKIRALVSGLHLRLYLCFAPGGVMCACVCVRA
jgi:hypothetical protein